MEILSKIEELKTKLSELKSEINTKRFNSYENIKELYKNVRIKNSNNIFDESSDEFFIVMYFFDEGNIKYSLDEDTNIYSNPKGEKNYLVFAFELYDYVKYIKLNSDENLNNIALFHRENIEEHFKKLNPVPMIYDQDQKYEEFVYYENLESYDNLELFVDPEQFQSIFIILDEKVKSILE